jgi:CheY-like chemotaxis protein
LNIFVAKTMRGWRKSDAARFKDHSKIQPMTLLYVEDDPDDCDLFIEAIHKINDIHPTTCIIAKDGEEALAKLIDFPQNPDLIFLDINIPLMDGKELVAEIKKNEKLKNIPIIVYSTTITSVDMQFFNRHGIFQFFNKPSDFDQLCDSLRLIFSKKKTGQLI